jgi:hypothetical protein
VIIDASQTEYIDFDVLDVIRDFAEAHAPDNNIKVSLIGFKESYNLPNAVSEREVLSTMVNANEMPKRSQGNYKNLLKQLTGNA